MLVVVESRCSHPATSVATFFCSSSSKSACENIVRWSFLNISISNEKPYAVKFAPLLGPLPVSIAAHSDAFGGTNVVVARLLVFVLDVVVFMDVHGLSERGAFLCGRAHHSRENTTR